MYFKVHENQTYCGSQQIVTTVYEYHKNTLEKEITRKQEIDLRYSKHELQQLITHTIHGLIHIYQQNTTCEDLTPKKILIDPLGNYKMITS